MSFDEYGLSPDILSGLADVRIDKPTPLQQEVLTPVLEGKHLLVKAGDGEEGIFLIPALQKIAGNGEVTGTQVLILTPSIERANKIDEMVWAMGYHAQISSALLSMKGNKEEQEKAVLDGAPVIVANPGRLIEILEKNDVGLNDLKLIVIDEAHNMDNFNLVNRVKDILRFVNGDPQTLILSGAQNNATRQLAEAVLKNPELIGFEAKNGESENGAQEVNSAEDVDLEAAEKKLEKAEVKVILNPEKQDQENKPESEARAETETDTKVDLQEAEKKLEEAEVEVVLDPEDEPTDEAESEDEEEAKAEINLDDAEQKLKEASVKVVLKKDLPEPAEQDESENASVDVEPVLANRILQGDDEPEAIDRSLEQGYINVPPRMKISTLMAHLEGSGAGKVAVFAASKRTTDRLFRIIRKKNWGVVSISESLDEQTYNDRFAKFTSGSARVLLVGGISATKVEIEAVEQVINYDVPDDVDEYRYRAELVGNGKAARIVSLVSKMDKEDIDRITKEVGYPPAELSLPVEVEEKKKKKSGKKSGSKGKSTGRSNNRNNNRDNNRNSGRGRNNSSRGKNTRGSGKSKRSGKRDDLSLPRPTYDGLSGGREGHKKKESGGVFGWVKKLFD